ncbi:MAG: hypothetical protein HYS25_09500 [Ignavibacteriales bacterium]|nr:hypothetical protein [Ignavibacteriales bacterium]
MDEYYRKIFPTLASGSFIDGTPAEKIYVLDPPTLLDTKNVSEISWQGSTLAKDIFTE